jgi:hypothetical protein
MDRAGLDTHRCDPGPRRLLLINALPDAKAPNEFIYLAYVGAVLLAVGVLALGVGLVRRPAQRS